MLSCKSGLGQHRYISVPPFPKRSFCKKGLWFLLRICLLVAFLQWDPDMLSIAASPCGSHTRFKWDVICAMPLCRARSVTICVTLLGWVQHITTSVNSCRNHMLCPKRSTSVEGHHSCHKQISSILQQVKDRWPGSGGNWHKTSRFTLWMCSVLYV